MVRTCSVDENGMKKGTWTDEEDRKLKAYIERYGHWNWRQLPKFAGLERCGKSCRLRWMNYLRPGVKRGNYTKEEEDLIIELHEKLGNRWSAIAAKLPGRTDNEVKNYWHTNLKKRFQKLQPALENAIGLSTEEASQSKVSQQEEQEPEISQVETLSQAETLSVESTSFESSAMESSATSLNSSRVAEDGISSSDSSFAESIESFWNEPFVLDTSYNQCGSSFFDVEEGFVSFSSYLDDSTDLVYQWIEGPSRNNYISSIFM